MRIFCDSDGVIYDFTQHVIDCYGGHPNEIGDAEMWRRINSDPNFWLTMPLMPDAMMFWNRIKPLNPIVLTGCHRDDFDKIAEHKLSRWKDDFGHSHVITCLSRDKALHMEQPGDVLIDDMRKNLKKWEKAGGVGVHFRNATQALAVLEALGILEATA